MKNVIIVLPALLIIAGCSSVQKGNRTVLDASKTKGSWVDRSDLYWEESGKFYTKAQHTIRGDQQISGCFSLAKLDAKENLLTAMSEEVKGVLDNASLDISENAETVLGKVRSSKWEGTVYGLKFKESYFERYEIKGNERIDCAVLSEITKSDYDKTKQSVINKVAAADPRIKEAIIKKQVDFFDASRNPTESKSE